MPINYNNGKIYKILNPQNEVIYVGSTTEKLCRRYSRHKHKAIGNKIILIENCPCNSREELIKKEQEFIDQYDNLLNQQRAYSSKEYYKEYYKEYSEKHKNKIKERKKRTYQNNKEKILEKLKVKITCECGCEITQSHILRHKKSKKHIDLMENPLLQSIVN
tara:strand:+ start:96 stop:581 length:486 start_codon:yes stop_codon:yes gene_type:complete